MSIEQITSFAKFIREWEGPEDLQHEIASVERHLRILIAKHALFRITPNAKNTFAEIAEIMKLKNRAKFELYDKITMLGSFSFTANYEGGLRVDVVVIEDQKRCNVSVGVGERQVASEEATDYVEQLTDVLVIADAIEKLLATPGALDGLPKLAEEWQTFRSVRQYNSYEEHLADLERFWEMT